RHDRAEVRWTAKERGNVVRVRRKVFLEQRDEHPRVLVMTGFVLLEPRVPRAGVERTRDRNDPLGQYARRRREQLATGIAPGKILHRPEARVADEVVCDVRHVREHSHVVGVLDAQIRERHRHRAAAPSSEAPCRRSMISSADVTLIARVPYIPSVLYRSAQSCSSTSELGRNTVRPCSSANRACMRAPDVSAAPMTTVASARPDITTLRYGNVHFVGGWSGKNCERSAPPDARISSASRRFCAG